MTFDFHDPYVARVFAAIGAARAGLQMDELAVECPESDAGGLRHALACLRAAGAITSMRGCYVAQIAPALSLQPRTASSTGTTSSTSSSTSSTSTITNHPKEINMAKKPQQPQTARASAIEPRVLELLGAAPCLLETLIERDGGAHDARAIKNALARLRAKGEVINLSGTPHRSIYGVRGAAKPGAKPGKSEIGEIAAITAAAGANTKTSTPRAAAKATRQATLDDIRAAQIEIAMQADVAERSRLRRLPAERSRLRRLPQAGKPRKLRKGGAVVRSHYDPIVAAGRTAVRGAPQGFRVGLFSDGTLTIVDNDREMQIDTTKTRALFSYLDKFQAMLGQTGQTGQSA